MVTRAGILSIGLQPILLFVRLPLQVMTLALPAFSHYSLAGRLPIEAPSGLSSLLSWVVCYTLVRTLPSCGTYPRAKCAAVEQRPSTK